MTERLVVVGGDAAGMSAAAQARRRADADDLEIVAFERGNFTSYSACGIPYWIGGVVADMDSLIIRSPERFRNSYSIDVRLRSEVIEMDPRARTVTVADRQGGGRSVEGFDRLVIATGATPKRPELEGIDAEGIFGVQTLDDGVAVHRFIDESAPSTAAVVGGGYIGLEMAEALKERGLPVTLLEQQEQPMSTLDPDMGSLVAEAIRGQGITLVTGEEVTGFESHSGRVRAVATSRGSVKADVVVMGLGVVPDARLAEGAGIAIGSTGGVAVDDHMATSIEGIWAGGDCVEKLHRLTGGKVSIALGTHANKEGRTSGINVTGGDAAFPGVIGTAVSKICDVEVGRTGLNEHEASEAGFETVSAVIESTTRAGYFPGSAPMHVKLVAEIDSGRVIGGQIVGKQGAAKRIDTLAAAVWNDMTVDEVINMDLSYAPPFSPLWDPILIAARKAWTEVIEARAGKD